MESDAQSGGSRQVRAQFINCVPTAAPSLVIGYARGGRLTRTGVGVFTFDPDPQPLTVGTGIAFAQGTCDPNRTSVQLFPRNAASPATFQAYFYTWNAGNTQLTITTEDNSAAADYPFDLFILEAERSGATGAS